MYRLILSDIDGTLLRDDLSIGAKTIQALKRAHERGIHFAYSSGRHRHACRIYNADLGFDPDYSLFNGGYIELDGKVLHKSLLSFGLIDQAAKLLRDIPCAKIAYTLDDFYEESDDAFFARQGFICRQSGHRIVLSDAVGMWEADGTEIYKLIIKAKDTETIQKVISALEPLSALSTMVQSTEVNLEVMPKGSHKGLGVSYLSKGLGIDKSECIAFGDYDNDIEMLEEAGLGIAMANASEACKSAADAITGNNNNDGIAMALEKYLLL